MKNCKPLSFFSVLILVRQFYSLIISDFSELTLETRGGDHFLFKFHFCLAFCLVSLNDIYLSYNFLFAGKYWDYMGGKKINFGKCISLFIKSSKIWKHLLWDATSATQRCSNNSEWTVEHRWGSWGQILVEWSNCSSSQESFSELFLTHVCFHLQKNRNFLFRIKVNLFN